jgi:hypothetical protein
MTEVIIVNYQMYAQRRQGKVYSSPPISCSNFKGYIYLLLEKKLSVLDLNKILDHFTSKKYWYDRGLDQLITLIQPIRLINIVIYSFKN